MDVKSGCMAAMRLRLFASLFLLTFSFALCVAESRYVTISVSGTNQTSVLAIQDFEVAKMVSAHDPLGTFNGFKLTVSKPSFTTQFDFYELQGYWVNNEGYGPAKPIVVTGPATLTLNSGIASRATNNAAFITFEILPETSPIDKTLILPPGTNQVEITLESSTNLVTWATATNGIYGSPDAARFFRIHLRKLD
jgi:hypothetical protein